MVATDKQLQHLEVDIDLNCNAQKLWDCIKNSTTVLPKAFGDKFESFQVVEGDGISAGTVFLVKFKPGHPFSHAKDRVELVDDKAKRYSYNMVEGDIMKSYEKFTVSIVLTDKGDDTTLMNWGCDFIYKKIEEEKEVVPVKAEDVMANAVLTAQELANYVVKQQEQHLDVDIDLNCNTQKLWDCIKNSTTVLPKAFGDKFESFQVVEGDGISAGTVFLVKFKPGHPFSHAKDRVELVDDKAKRYTYNMVEGDIMKSYEKFTVSIVLTDKGDDTTLMNWGCDFIYKKTKEEEEVVPVKAEDVMANAVLTAQELANYVVKEC